MSAIVPESLLGNKLVTVFPAAQVAPAGTVVYHADGDPIPPFVLYRRTNTSVERDLAGTPMVRVEEFEVLVSSMFFNQLETTMPDNWTDGSWYFTLDGQYSDAENYQIVFVYTAASAF